MTVLRVRMQALWSAEVHPGLRMVVMLVFPAWTFSLMSGSRDASRETQSKPLVVDYRVPYHLAPSHFLPSLFLLSASAPKAFLVFGLANFCPPRGFTPAGPSVWTLGALQGSLFAHSSLKVLL